MSDHKKNDQYQLIRFWIGRANTEPDGVEAADFAKKASYFLAHLLSLSEEGEVQTLRELAAEIVTAHGRAVERNLVSVNEAVNMAHLGDA